MIYEDKNSSFLARSMIFCSLEHKTITNAKKVGAVNRSFLTNKFCFSRVTSEVANNTYYYRRENVRLTSP